MVTVVSPVGKKLFDRQQEFSSPRDTCKFVMLVSLLPLFLLQTSALPSQRCEGRIAIFLFPSSPTTSLQKPMWPLSQTGLIFFLVFYHKERKLLEDNDLATPVHLLIFHSRAPVTPVLVFPCCTLGLCQWESSKQDETKKITIAHSLCC